MINGTFFTQKNGVFHLHEKNTAITNPSEDSSILKAIVRILIRMHTHSLCRRQEVDAPPAHLE